MNPIKELRIGRCVHLCPFTVLMALATVLLLIAFPQRARADLLIDFEHAPFPTNAAPNYFLAVGAMQSNGIAGVYNISGGAVLGNPTFLPAFRTNSRATTTDKSTAVDMGTFRNIFLILKR